LSIIKTGVIES